MAENSRYRTLDLVRALATGWGDRYKLTERETRVLQFVALHGKRGDGGCAFSWYHPYGVEVWGDMLAIPRRGFFRVLKALEDKGLLVPLGPSTTDRRFSSCGGRGIPEAVAEEFKRWSEERSSVSRMLHSLTSEEEITEATINGDQWDRAVGLGKPKCHQCHLGGDTSVTPECHQCHSANALTRDDALHNPGRTREVHPLLTQPTQASEAKQLTIKEERDMAFRTPSEDELWAAPSDTDDDFDAPAPEPRPARRKAPTSRLADEFYDRWLTARKDRPMLPLPWSNKAAFLATMKRLLKDHTEEQVVAMFDAFFASVAAGTARMGSPELWRDFLNNRAAAWKSVQASSGGDDRAEERDVEIEQLNADLAARRALRASS